jgi:organic hydroperoxide reductase OsmC/OhrA
MKRFGGAAWSGSLREGKGSVATESRALENYPYTFSSRYGEKPGTQPEELLGAAHAACFTMSFVRLLGMAKFIPEQLDTKSEVVVDQGWRRVFHHFCASHGRRQNIGEAPHPPFRPRRITPAHDQHPRGRRARRWSGVSALEEAITMPNCTPHP